MDGVGFNPEALVTAERGMVGAGVRNRNTPIIVGAVVVVLLAVFAYDRHQQRVRRKRRRAAL